MNAEQIRLFLEKKVTSDSPYVKIDFRTRDSVYGLFVTEANDYRDLSSKNFWRIVTRKNFDNYNRSRSLEFAKIFNGAEFSRLSLLNDEF